MKVQKNFYVPEHHNLSAVLHTAAVCAGMLAAVVCISCRSEFSNPVIIWTSQSNFAPYTEVFNASQDKVKAVVVYKENPAALLPVDKNEPPPDIIIGTSLRTEKAIKNFRSLNYLLSSQEINKNIFYPQLLAACKRKGYTYLLPVSFNLPAVIFSSDNANLISDNYMLSMDQIRTLASSYNQKNAGNVYTQMGFAPQWNKDFLYLAAELSGADFHEKGATLVWNKEALDSAITFLRTWTSDANTSPSDEQDFSFKYLYTPSYKQVLSGRCLFSYITSDNLFSLTAEQLNKIDFRWIHKDNKIPLSEAMMTLGMYKKAKNKKGAEKFIAWFFTEAAQKSLIEHSQKMKLTTMTFGIAGGFSSLKGVNERVFPTYYNPLLANVPVATYIQPLSVQPLRWDSIKARVILPYLTDAVNAGTTANIKTIEDRLVDWSKQYY